MDKLSKYSGFVMVSALKRHEGPLGLVVTGEAEDWQPALEQIVGPKLLVTFRVKTPSQFLEVLDAGLAQAAVLDEAADLHVGVMGMLRMIRKVNSTIPVVVVARQMDRRMMEEALRLAAFSVVAKPLALEELLRQVQRMMFRLDQMLRHGGQE